MKREGLRVEAVGLMTVVMNSTGSLPGRGGWGRMRGR